MVHQFYVLILADFLDLARNVISKYTLEQFNTPEVLGLFDFVHANRVSVTKMMDLIEKEDGWTGQKVDGNMKIGFKQV